MSISTFNFCKTRRAASRDGYSGGSFMEVPFYPGGFFSPSGQQLAFPASNLPVARGTTMNGRVMPDTYSKGSSLCR